MSKTHVVGRIAPAFRQWNNMVMTGTHLVLGCIQFHGLPTDVAVPAVQLPDELKEQILLLLASLCGACFHLQIIKAVAALP
jgi:hypothetical protein